MSSLMSINEAYGSRDFDNHDQCPAKSFKRNTGKRLSLRSGTDYKTTVITNRNIKRLVYCQYG